MVKTSLPLPASQWRAESGRTRQCSGLMGLKQEKFKPVPRYAAYTPYTLHPNPVRGALAFRGQPVVRHISKTLNPAP